MVSAHGEPEERNARVSYIPQTDQFVRENCPIRDIASVWDTELLGKFLDRQALRPIIAKSLGHFSDYVVRRGDYLILDSARLGEAASIAHSAFMTLALLHAPPLQNFSGTQKIKGLADGIVGQQRADGSYKVSFEDVPDHGEELYAGEAMLALLEAYRQLPDAGYLQSVERAFAYYDSQYFQRDYVSDHLLVFFANWQSQACRLLFQSTSAAPIKRSVARSFSRCMTGSLRATFIATSRATRNSRCRWQWSARWKD